MTKASLILQESNRQHIEHVLSGAIIKSKMLTPHQTGQLILFMVDHSKVIFEDPPQLEQALINTSHGTDVPTPGKINITIAMSLNFDHPNDCENYLPNLLPTMKQGDDTYRSVCLSLNALMVEQFDP